MAQNRIFPPAATAQEIAQFALTPEELQTITELKAEEAQLLAQFDLMDLRLEEVKKFTRELTFHPDTELQRMIAKLAEPHGISCDINRLEQKIYIVIEQCDRRSDVARIFSDLLDTEITVQSGHYNPGTFSNRSSRVTVVIDLALRNNLIHMLQNRSQGLSIPYKSPLMD